MDNLNISSVRPSDFNTGDHFWDSPFRDSNLETLARNIILISVRLGNVWTPFTWEEYRSQCKCQVSLMDLNTMVNKGYLDFKGNKFSVNDRFIVALKKFMK